VVAVHLAIAAVCLAVAAFYLRDARPASGAGSLRGVVDGGAPLGVEDEAAVGQRKAFLRTIGYKQ
jgi:adenosine/AMP kinase